MYRQGLGELNDRIAAARATMARRKQLERTLATTREQRDALKRRVAELAATLAKEQSDVARLEGNGLIALFHALLGSKEQRLETERHELLVARLAHDEAAAELSRTVKRETALAAEAAELAGADAALSRLLADKEAWLEQHGGPAAEELFAMAEEIARLEALVGEIDEAARSGDDARGHLDSMRRFLSEPQSWGVITSFQRELEGMELQILLQILIDLDIDSWSGDYFLDGLISDWRVQTKIKKAHETVVEALDQVNAALSRLAERREPLIRRLDAMLARRVELIETW